MSNIQTQPKKEDPSKQPATTAGGEQSLTTPLKWYEKLGAGIIVLLVVFIICLLLLFNVGAALLSYHKYGSYFWAFVNFFFAVIYYPFYAFFLDTNTPPVSTPSEGMVGGVIKMLGGRRRKH